MIDRNIYLYSNFNKISMYCFCKEERQLSHLQLERNQLILQELCKIPLLPFLKKDFIYSFLETGEGESEGEKYQCVVASCTPPTGDLAYNPGMVP